MTTIDYATMSVKVMVEYVKDNGTDEEKKGLKAALAPQEVEKDGKTQKEYNVRAGKKYFYETYKDKIEFQHPPKKRNLTTWEILMSW